MLSVQDARCWYNRSGLQCYRAGGNTCYSDTPTGMNREHGLFEAARCIGVSPSDVAPAVVELNGRMVIRNASGAREVPAPLYFVGPAVNLTRMVGLQAGRPARRGQNPQRAGATFYFEKVSERAGWDFPLLNVAAAMKCRAASSRT